MSSQALPVYFRLIDLEGVPIPDFVEALDYERIRQSAIDYLVTLDPAFSALLESDPAIKVIEAFAYRELILRQRINDAARANTITLATGADLDNIGAFVSVGRLEGETDDRYRKRVQQGLALLAAAGPREAYIAHAMAVSTDVIDVAVHSPAPGEVVVTVLAFDELAETEATPEEKTVGRALFAQPTDPNRVRILARNNSPLIAAVKRRVSADDVRPLTDAVTVRPPNVLAFTVAARLVIYPGPDGATVKANAEAALSAYLRKVRRVSYDATVSGIITALSVPGVQSVILDSPLMDVAASYFDLPVCTGVSVSVERVDV